MTGNETWMNHELGYTFDLSLTDSISKEELLEALQIRIEQLLAGAPERLFSLLYRLDISEQLIKESLDKKENLAQGLAMLIYQRQIEKMESRKRYKKKPYQADNDLVW